MSKYVLANWKAYKNRAEAEEWIEKFLKIYQPSPKVEVILAPSFVYLEFISKKIKEARPGNVHLAAQDISPFPLGAYTGAVAADMLRGLAEFSIVGHAERRRYFHETNQEIANKVREAMDAGIDPILCLDRSYARAQIAALDEDGLERLIIGYGPVGSIGMEVPQDLNEAREGIRDIKKNSPSSAILYGGSIRESNASDYIRIEDLDGLMISTGSLDPVEFAAICDIVANT